MSTNPFFFLLFFPIIYIQIEAQGLFGRGLFGGKQTEGAIGDGQPLRRFMQMLKR